MASNSHGGYRRKAGRGTPYNFNSVTFDSYGEFCFYLHFFDVHNKYPKKCIESIETLVDDKPYRYTPDFQCDEIFYEIKGFDFHGWNSKKVSNVIGLVVIQTSEIENIIQYCENKYGIDWLNKHKI